MMITPEDIHVLYSQEDIQRLAQKLQPLTNRSEAEKQQHIDEIKEKCPFCGKEEPRSYTLTIGDYFSVDRHQ